MNFQELAKEMEVLSPKEVIDCIIYHNDFNDGINYYINKKKNITKPIKPKLRNGSSVKELQELIPKLQEYELLEEQYQIDYKEAKTYNYNIELLIREMIIIYCEVYNKVPSIYQNNVINTAFERGCGYLEQMYELHELVEIFNVK